MKKVSLLLFIFMLTFASILFADTNFYRENRNGRGFVLQVDPDTNIETVYNFSKDFLFLAPGAQRITVLPTAGWGETVTNTNPLGDPLPSGIRPGDLNAVLTLRILTGGDKVRYRIVAGAGNNLYTIVDDIAAAEAAHYDIAASQYMGVDRNQKRIYVYISNFEQSGAALFRLEFVGNSLVEKRLWRQNGEHENWDGTLVDFEGNNANAQAIHVNATSDQKDLVVFQPSRDYSLQHVWDAANNNGKWGVNYLLDHNAVYRAPSSDPLTSNKAEMTQLFDVAVDLGDAYPDSLQYMRGYYNHGTTIFINNVSTNQTYSNLYYSIEMPGGPEVEIRDGSPDGPVLTTMNVNPNPVVIGHNYTGYFNLSCRDATTGTELVIYEPVYKVNPAAIAENEISDVNRNNIPDHIDNDGKGYFAYRDNFFINSSSSLPASDRGRTLHSDYKLEYVIAHRFCLDGKTAEDVFTYREHRVTRDPSTDPASLMKGAKVHVRLGNVFHRNPDYFHERNQFGWNDQPGNNLWIWVGNPDQTYDNPNPGKRCAGYPSPCTWAESDSARQRAFELEDAQFRNSGRILGIEIRNTSYATADHFGVVGNDEWNSGQGDLYFLSRQYDRYESARIVDSNNTKVPPVTGYGRWWEYEYDRETYYGVSRTYWIGASNYTDWIDNRAFFIGTSVFSQMVYNINCGCRGARYTNFQPVYEASAPILDFALVNIGAPPYIDGTIAPTIEASVTDVQVGGMETPVYFHGSWSDFSGLLVGSDNVEYRFVILDGAFQDEDPHLSDDLVVDSLVETGGMLSTPDWHHRFTTAQLGDREVATFTVYLGISFRAQDYDSIDYPYYSWWDIPERDYFAWSNSDNGKYYDGRLHGLYGAPLRITIDTRPRTTTLEPLVITSLKAVDSSGTVSDATFDVEQGASFTVRINGQMQYLGYIPEPRAINYEDYGGILPHDENRTVRLLANGDQADVEDNTFSVDHERFLKDLRNVEYHLYARAYFLPDEDDPDESISYTRTLPEINDDSKNRHLLEGYDHEDFQWIASGTLVCSTLIASHSAISLFKSSGTRVFISPADTAPKRVFNFVIETDELVLPVPLQAADLFDTDDPADKYEFRVAFSFPTGEWDHVTVRDYDSGLITQSYNVAKGSKIVRSNSDNIAHRLFVNVLDTQPPVLSGFDFEAVAFTGDPMPYNDKTLTMRDNNPNDYWIRDWNAPQLYWAYSIGGDQYLSLSSDLEDDLGFDFANRFSSSLYNITSNILSIGETYWRHSDPITLGEVTRQLAEFPDSSVYVHYAPADPIVLSAKTEAAPIFNADKYQMQWILSEVDSGIAMSISNPDVKDANDNAVDLSTITGVTEVRDNDPPNLRLFLQDNAGLDVMLEVRGGLVDEDELSDRTLVLVDLSKRGLESIMYEALVATTTAHDSLMKLSETYELSAGGSPSNYTVLTPLSSSNIPIEVNPDDRVIVRGVAFDNSSGKIPVSLTIDADPEVKGNDQIETVFRRGLSGNQYTITAETGPEATHSVKFILPIVVGDGERVRMRVLESQRQRKQD